MILKKSVILYFVAIFFLLSTACAEGDKNVNGENEYDPKDAVVDEVEEGISVDEESSREEKQAELVEDENEQQEEDKQEEEVVVSPRYALQTNEMVKPIDEKGNENVVLLTIDDAPEHYSVDMAKLLKEKEVNAIFFVNGHFIMDETGREKLQVIYDLGFEIGNHTMTHPNLRDLSEEEQRKEIVELNDLIEDIIGERPRFFRAPFGVNTEVSRQVVLEENMQWMNWTYGYDYFQPYMNAEALTEAMVTGKGPEVDVPYSLLKPGANLLMHDRKWTLEALPDIITGLREKGYEFVDPKLIE